MEGYILIWFRQGSARARARMCMCVRTFIRSLSIGTNKIAASFGKEYKTVFFLVMFAEVYLFLTFQNYILAYFFYFYFYSLHIKTNLHIKKIYAIYSHTKRIHASGNKLPVTLK